MTHAGWFGRETYYISNLIAQEMFFLPYVDMAQMDDSKNISCKFANIQNTLENKPSISPGKTRTLSSQSQTLQSPETISSYMKVAKVMRPSRLATDEVSKAVEEYLSQDNLFARQSATKLLPDKDC